MKVTIQGSPKELAEFTKQLTTHKKVNASEIAKSVERQIAKAEMKAFEQLRNDYK